jgi:hypothetical protein
MPAPIIYADQVIPVVGNGFGVPYSDEGARAIAQLPADKLTEFARMQASDPVTYGWCFPAWLGLLAAWVTTTIFVILGGNRSGKSTLCARLVIWVAMHVPGARIRCWSANEESSITDQQRMIWNELPGMYKNLPKKRFAPYSVDYTQKNGFTGGKLILPPVQPGYDSSEIIFQTYKSWANDDKVAEGWWAHLVWCDEEVPAKLLETLEYRLRDARGKLLLSFTTINGWTVTVSKILSKAKTVAKRFASLVGRELPVELLGDVAGRTRIWCFWSEDNIFLPQDVRDGKDMVGKQEAEVLARQYGWPTKSKVAKFPLFNKEVHVVEHAKVPVLKDPGKWTWYTALDPAGSKNWFMLWGAVDAAGRLWITHEWPDCPTYGEWVDNTGAEGGRPGPGQKGMGYGINDYVDRIKEVEETLTGVDVDAVNRAVDPRMGASETQGENGAETIISRLDDAGYVYQPAPGKQIEDGEALINDRLAYDLKRPVGADNSPRLLISDRCENLIQAMELYAGTGKDEPAKDPVDALRYMLQSGVEYVDPEAPVVTGGGSY